MARHKDTDWILPAASITFEQASLAVLMDIRDELRLIRRAVECFRVRRALDDVNRIERRLANRIPLNPRRKRNG